MEHLPSETLVSSEPITLPCKRHKWKVIGESKPRLVRSTLTTRDYRWYEPVKCSVCGRTKTRPT